MTAIQDTYPAQANSPLKSRARDLTSQSAPWLEALDHLDTVESLLLTVLRRMETEEDWGPEQTTLMVGLEYLKRAEARIRAIRDVPGSG